MNYIEYNEDNVELNELQAEFIPQDLYENIHENSVILCHDVFIIHTIGDKKGVLLVKRLKEPAKNVLWPIGGRVLRGVPTEDSLTMKAKSESGLSLKNIQHLGTARTFFKGEPFGHTHGTDTLNLVYVAEGEGELRLDSFHESPLVLTKESYLKNEHPLPDYVRRFLDILITQNLLD